MNELRLLAAATMAVLAASTGCRSAREDQGRRDQPRVVLHQAPLVQMRGTKSPAPAQPGDCDCNSPAHWEGDTLFIFNSAGHPWRSAGPDLFHLDQDYRRCEYDNTVNGGRW